MDRTERRTRSPDSGGGTSERRSRRRAGSREYTSSGSHRRRSRSWSSRSRSRDRDRRSSHRRYNHHHSRSRSRSYDRAGGGGGSSNVYHRGGSPDQYNDMLDDSNDHYSSNNDRHYERSDRGDRNDRTADRHHRSGSSSRQYHQHRSDGGVERHRYRSDYDRHDRRRGRDRSDDSFLDELQSRYNFDGDQQPNSDFYRNQTPSNKVIILGLAHHISETDISNDLIHYGLHAVSIRLIRKRKTGASRGFAFVEFDTQEEATRWMEYKQGVLMVHDQFRSVMQYSNIRDGSGRDRISNDWFCVKCGVFNFKRRDTCYKCSASREESEKGGEGHDEVSTVLTKKILLRNLDVLTNEEGVLTHMQRVVPTLVDKIAKIQVCRDPLTQTSRGVCYLAFDNLVDAMNTHNALNALEPALSMEGRDVIITYCVDASQSSSLPNTSTTSSASVDHRATDGSTANKYHQRKTDPTGPLSGHVLDEHSHHHSHHHHHHHPHRLAPQQQQPHYTLDDVPRLAEYSAGVYASSAAEHAHFRTYYTDYYVTEIGAGRFDGLPTMAQIDAAEENARTTAVAAAAAAAAAAGAQAAAASRLLGANSGAAVALSAIQRKLHQQGGRMQPSQQRYGRTDASALNASGGTAASGALQVPTGRDNKKYATPDVSLYQYDEQSTYYYDPLTGLYYDANSQYYYNGDTGEYMYWNAEHSTYTVAPATRSDSRNSPPSVATASSTTQPRITPQHQGPTSLEPNTDHNRRVDEAQPSQPVDDAPPASSKSAAKVPGADKVKVAKKIVKDMERWAKQLNQKKDQMYQLQPTGGPPSVAGAPAHVQPDVAGSAAASHSSGGGGGGGGSSGYADVGFAILENKERPLMSAAATAALISGKSTLVTYDSDNSDGEQPTQAAASAATTNNGMVAYDRLTCLLCKRAFPSADVLTKHVQMSQLHKDNMRKLQQQQQRANGANGSGGIGGVIDDEGDDAAGGGLSYRDRAKERRQKYGEPEPPPVARAQNGTGASMAKQQQQALAQSQVVAAAAAGKQVASQPISQSNVGNRLLQKMGWQEGQGLGRANQGRTNIIEAESRAPAAGLGTKSTAFVPGDDYKTYIKRMMKSRYDQAED